MKATFLLLVIAASLPLASAAQTASSSPHFYVGLGASALTDIGFRPISYDYDPVRVGPSLTFGVWLTPRLAVQVNGAVAWRHDTSTYTFYAYSTSGTPLTFTNTIDSRQTLYTLPVLLRYTLTPIPARFHLDVLGGLTLLHSTLRSTETSTSSSYPYVGSYAREQTRANVTLGPALRYTFTPQFEATASPLVNVALGNYYGDFRNRLFWNMQVGLNYHFGH